MIVLGSSPYWKSEASVLLTIQEAKKEETKILQYFKDHNHNCIWRMPDISCGDVTFSEKQELGFNY